MIRYKLTNPYHTTYNGFLWTPDQWRTPTGKSCSPCSNGVFHYYDDPHLALLINPIHANINCPLVWTFEIDREIGHDGLKGWCKRARIVEQITTPVITTEQRVEFSIRCAMLNYHETEWIVWAQKWLSGENRNTHDAANAAKTAYEKARSSISDVATDVAYAATDAAYAAAHGVYAENSAASVAFTVCSVSGATDTGQVRKQIKSILNEIFQ